MLLALRNPLTTNRSEAKIPTEASGGHKGLKPKFAKKKLTLRKAGETQLVPRSGREPQREKRLRDLETS
jgi:hypothetical protein